MAADQPADDDYELEEVDPEILEMQRRRMHRHVLQSDARAAQEELFDQQNRSEPIDFEDFGPIRFTTRHLLIATAVLAIAMALFKSLGGSLIFVVWIVGLAVAWWIVLRREKAEARKRELLRQELEARIAAVGEDGKSVLPSRKTIEADHELEQLLNKRPALSFNFSIKQMMTAIAIAAVLLTMVRFLGPGPAALVLGLIAGIGLVLHLLGADPPPLIVFGWWVLLVLYVAMGLLASLIG